MPWHGPNPPRARQRILGPADPRAPARRARYGLKPDQRDALLRAQGGVCAGCGTSDWGPLGPVLDHDHGCRECAGVGCRFCVRGLLCNPDNLALGWVKDNPITLRRLADYIESRRPR